MPKKGDITRALEAWNRGDTGAFASIAPLVFKELRGLAAGKLRGERANRSLQPTDLVNEAFLRLWSVRQPDWKNRAHFFAASANIMRRILVDQARRRNADRRGGDCVRVDMADAERSPAPADFDVQALDAALERLAQFDPRQANIVELRFFSGLSIEETAEALGLSVTTVKRDWALARAWLKRELERA